MVCSSFIAGQVDEGDFSELLLTVLEYDLQNSMRSGRVSIGCILGGDPESTAVLDHFQELAGRADVLLLHADDIDIALLVLSDLEFGSVV